MLHFARFLSTPFEFLPHFCPNFNFSAVLRGYVLLRPILLRPILLWPGLLRPGAT